MRVILNGEHAYHRTSIRAQNQKIIYQKAF